MISIRAVGLVLGVALLLTPRVCLAQPMTGQTPSPDQIAFFEKKIRPVLISQCYSCHSAESGKDKGGLRLDSRDSILQGGESGPAVVPHKPRESLLIKAIQYKDKNLQMPPKEKLSDEVIADFEKWISMGAPDPRQGGATPAVTRGEIDIKKGREFWAFKAPKKSSPPSVKNEKWPVNDIDRYLLASMEAKNVKPVADADAYTLVRRVYLDLLGLPPTAEEVRFFVKDSSQRSISAALESLIDKLLASPQYGERWGRYWLDVARYGETTGKQVNQNFPHAWRYRDYVIASFNKDKPYDVFVREQIAGDLLPSKDDKEKAERLIATGFLAIGTKGLNERNQLQFQMDIVDEQIDTTFLAFQALTVACARCHDHKFDPISMKDYYALAGIFRSTETMYGTIRVIQNFHPSSLISLPEGSAPRASDIPLSAEERTRLEKQIADLKKEFEDLRKDPSKAFGVQGLVLRSRISQQESRLNLYNADGTMKLLAMGVKDRFRTMDSPVYTRGEIDKPGSVVPRGLPQVLVEKQPTIRRGSSGRLELAEWMSSKNNPLTARVMVNRVWSHIFGRGLVATPDNFGATGQTPSHPELLDALAISFMDNGWSVKRLIKQIMLSHAYRLGSQSDAKNAEVDPDNVLIWRMSPRRLDAEAIRDSMLAISGRLNLTPPRGSAVSRAGEGGTQILTRFGGFSETSFVNRAVYLPIIRDQLPECLNLFDFPDASFVSGDRATTSVPAQSLYLMNNPFVIQQANATATRIMALGTDDAYRIQQAYLAAFGREPTAKEIEAAKSVISKYPVQAAPRFQPKRGLFEQRLTPVDAKTQPWSAFCQALFASSEFLYRN